MRLCNGYIGEENYEHSKIITLSDKYAVTTNARPRRVHRGQ